MLMGLKPFDVFPIAHSSGSQTCSEGKALRNHDALGRA